MRSALFLLAVLVPESVFSAPASVRVDSNGRPCFTVDAAAEQKDGTAQFRSITVTEAASGAVAWQMALPSGRSFALTHAVCIPYAGRVNALPQTPAVILVEGRVYRATLAVRNWERPRAPRAYTAQFCIAGKTQAVYQLDAQAGCPAGP